jgi:hypothetical protein
MSTKMEMRPGGQPATSVSGRGSGAVARRQPGEARRKLLIRLPETMVRELKLVAAHKETSIQDYCEQILGPAIQQDMATRGLRLDPDV